MSKTQQADESWILASRLLDFIDHLQRLGKIRFYHSKASHIKKLSIHQLSTLAILRIHPGATQKLLAEKLKITAASISVLVRELVDLGLVKREPDPNDMRSMNLYLTGKGKKLIQQLEDDRIQGVAELLQILPIEEQRHIIAVFEQVISTLSAVDNASD
jgi:DNA-binding MarR family transcriptional regulator